MKKKLLLTLMMVAISIIVFGTISVSAATSGTYGDNLTWTLDNNGTLTISGSGDMPNYYYSSVPWYSSNTNIKKVVLDNNITSIGEYAFYNCKNLTSINIPSGIKKIGKYAFSYCSNLSSVTIPNGVTEITYNSFAGCGSLNSIVIPNSVTKIDGYAFNGCTRLSNITMSSNITSIDFYAFTGTGYYNSSYNWNNKVLYIGKYLIEAKDDITSCTIKSGTKLIADDAFDDCTSLKSITIPNGVTHIGEYAFSGCEGLTSITISDTVTGIGTGAFGGCSSLTSITIPQGVTLFEDSLLTGCTSLQNITIHENVTKIGDSAFKNCTALTQINWNSKNVTDYPGSYDNPFASAGQKSNGIKVIFGENVESIPRYAFYSSSSSSEPNLKEIIIGSKVAIIGDYAFYQNKTLTNITIPQNVKAIGTSAFSYCSALTKVTLLTSDATIDSYAFSGCSALTGVYITNLEDWCEINFSSHASNPLYVAGKLYVNGIQVTELTIPSAVKEIKDYAFCGFSTLTSLDISTGVTTIGESAFSSCAALTKVKIPASVTEIDSSFGGCSALKDVNITDINAWCNINFTRSTGSNPLRYAENLVLNGTKVTEVTIPESMTEIKGLIFYGYDGLKKLTIHNGITSIGVWAFYDCTGLTDVTIPGSVQNIGESAFSGCTGLKDITLCDGIKTIDGSAFGRCTGLTEIIIPSSVTTIGVTAFSDCTGLIQINIPVSVESIGNKPFVNCSNLNQITVDSSNQHYSSLDGVLFNKDCTELIQYPAGRIQGVYHIPKSVTKISESAFRNCQTLTCISIPENIETFGSYAFSGCTKLTEIIWNVKNIADFTNSNTIFDAAGLDDDGIKVTFGDNVEKIPAYLFYVSTSYLKLPKIISVEFGKGVKSIGTYAFGYNEYLTELVIPDNVTTINSYAFYQCKKLSTLKLSSGLKSMGSNAFSYCNGIKELEIPEGITNIDSWVFSSCSNLTELTLPRSLTNIANYAFYYCNKISTINYNGNETDWGKITIGSNNTSLTNATKNYFWYVTYVGENGETIQKDIVANNGTVIFPELTVPEDYVAEFYTDSERKTLFNVENPVTENTTLFVDYKLSLLNNIEIVEPVTTQPGATKVAQTVRFATDKEDSVALVVELKIPEYIVLNSISPIDFEIAESDYYTQDHYTYLTIIGQYTNNGDLIPVNEIITPFEVLFDVSKTAETDDATIEFTDNTYLMGSDSYTFDKKTNSEFTIEAKLMEKIEIVGDDSITVPTKYGVIVIPDYTTNPSVTWSVDDETIATVSTDGLLTPLKGGTVTLTATANDGSGVSASKQITIVTRAVISSLVSNIGTWDKEFDPYVNDYIVYMGEDETVIKLTSNFASGTLRVNNSLTVKNFAKPVDIKNNITKITLSLTGGTDLLDNTYTVTVIKGNDALVGTAETSENGYSFEVFMNKKSISNFETATLIVSVYGDNDRLITLTETPITTTDGIVPISVKTTEVAKKAKLMLWKDFETLIPLCESTEITLR